MKDFKFIFKLFSPFIIIIIFFSIIKTAIDIGWIISFAIHSPCTFGYPVVVIRDICEDDDAS